MNTLLTRVSEGVLEVEMHRPERLNAMSAELMTELAGVFEGCEQGAVLLTGAGRAFCSGADLRQVSFDEASVKALQQVASRLTRAMDACDAAIVSHVQGPAIGGGFCLVMLSDLVFATPEAIFAANQMTRGLVPDMGLLQLLPRALGEFPARRLMLLGERLGAEEAVRLGIAAGIADLEQTRAVARSLAANREALTLAKRGVRLGRSASLAEVLEFEVEAEAVAFATEKVQRSITEFRGA